MRTRHLLLCLVAACGGSDPAPQNPPPAGSGAASSPPPAGSGTGSDPAPSAAPSGSPKPDAPAYDAKTPAEVLALDLLTKRETIGWNAAKVKIVYAAELHTDAKNYQLSVSVRDPKTGKDVETWDICAPCGSLEKNLAKKVPELAKKLDGYASIAGAALPSGGRADPPGSKHSIGFDNGKVTIGATGSKATKILATLKAAPPHKPHLERVWILEDVKLVIGRVMMEAPAGSKDALPFQQLHVFSLP
jgi:hypothetical protein